MIEEARSFEAMILKCLEPKHFNLKGVEKFKNPPKCYQEYTYILQNFPTFQTYLHIYF